MVKAIQNKNQNPCMFMVKRIQKNYLIICTNQQDFEFDFIPIAC